QVGSPLGEGGMSILGVGGLGGRDRRARVLDIGQRDDARGFFGRRIDQRQRLRTVRRHEPAVDVNMIEGLHETSSSFWMSRIGGAPNMRRYSRLNCEGLS